MQIFMNEQVKWNPEEKIIGVVGVAPAATADFYHKLIQLTPVKKDWEHVRVIVDSNPKIPSRGRYFELGETDPVPYIRQAILQLHQMGASIIAIPCNTAHILYDRYAENLPVIIPNMIVETAIATQQICGNKLQSVAVFASKLTQHYRLYEKAFKDQQVTLLDTLSHQAEVTAIIEQVKQGQSLSAMRNRINKLFSEYKTADAFIIGCTELSLLIKTDFEGIPVIDSNQALAEACLKLSANHAFNQSRFKQEICI